MSDNLKERITWRCDPSMRDELEAIADEYQVDISVIVREACDRLVQAVKGGASPLTGDNGRRISRS